MLRSGSWCTLVEQSPGTRFVVLTWAHNDFTCSAASRCLSRLEFRRSGCIIHFISVHCRALSVSYFVLSSSFHISLPVSSFLLSSSNHISLSVRYVTFSSNSHSALCVSYLVLSSSNHISLPVSYFMLSSSNNTVFS